VAYDLSHEMKIIYLRWSSATGTVYRL